MRCGSKVGLTLTLRLWPEGPWDLQSCTHSPVSAGRDEELLEMPGYLGTWRLVETFAVSWVGAAAVGHVPWYISVYRVPLAGQETEGNAYGLGQAWKVYGTFCTLVTILLIPPSCCLHHLPSSPALSSAAAEPSPCLCCVLVSVFGSVFVS